MAQIQYSDLERLMLYDIKFEKYSAECLWGTPFGDKKESFVKLLLSLFLRSYLKGREKCIGNMDPKLSESPPNML